MRLQAVLERLDGGGALFDLGRSQTKFGGDVDDGTQRADLMQP
jgi:hypothetical protein